MADRIWMIYTSTGDIQYTRYSRCIVLHVDDISCTFGGIFRTQRHRRSIFAQPGLEPRHSTFQPHVNAVEHRNVTHASAYSKYVRIQIQGMHLTTT